MYSFKRTVDMSYESISNPFYFLQFILHSWWTEGYKGYDVMDTWHNTLSALSLSTGYECTRQAPGSYQSTHQSQCACSLCVCVYLFVCVWERDKEQLKVKERERMKDSEREKTAAQRVLVSSSCDLFNYLHSSTEYKLKHFTSAVYRLS